LYHSTLGLRVIKKKKHVWRDKQVVALLTNFKRREFVWLFGNDRLRVASGEVSRGEKML